MRSTVIIVSLSLALGVAGYMYKGSPAQGDLPFATRQADLASKNPELMTDAERLARLEGLVRERPDDPQPHYFIGQILKAQGRPDDAVRAYQSALRRDEEFVPAMMGLADTFTRMSGGSIAPDTGAIYLRAYQLDPSLVRAGFFAAMPDWEAGNTEAARAWWNQMRKDIPVETEQAGMLEALISAIDPGNVRPFAPSDAPENSE